MTLPVRIARTLTRRARLALFTAAVATLPLLPALAQEPDAPQAEVHALKQQTEINRLRQLELKQRIAEIEEQRAAWGYRPAHTRYKVLQLKIDELQRQRDQLAARGEMTNALTLIQQRRELEVQRARRRARALNLAAGALLDKGMSEEAEALLALAKELQPSPDTSTRDADARTRREYGRNSANLGRVRLIRPAPADPIHEQDSRSADRPSISSRDGARIDRIEQRLDELAAMIEKLAARGGER